MARLPVLKPREVARVLEKMGFVEVRQREMMNLTLALQIGEMFERVEVALVAIVPPMELKKVEAVDAHP